MEFSAQDGIDEVIKPKKKPVILVMTVHGSMNQDIAVQDIAPFHRIKCRIISCAMSLCITSIFVSAQSFISFFFKMQTIRNLNILIETLRIIWLLLTLSRQIMNTNAKYC